MFSRKHGDFVFSIPLPRQYPEAKVGPNAPCPCGSGKKFKKCCRNAPARPIEIVPPALVEETERRSRLHQARRQDHLENFGHAREAVHADWQGRKVVAVGSKILINPPNRRWATFHDFLKSYAEGRLGGEGWANAERAKPPDQRHPLYRMREGMLAFMIELQSRVRPDSRGIYSADWNGDIAGFMTFAYDLWVLDDNAEVQRVLLERLQHVDQWRGARYELFAAATCVRAGYTIDYEDETDGSRRHPELIATHRRTGARIAVEAKARQRPGALGFGRPSAVPPAAADPAGLRGLFLGALDKEPAMPLAVFLDVNLPYLPGVEQQPWVREFETETLAGLLPEDWARFNLVICTNFPFHYSTPDEATQTRTTAGRASPTAKYPFDLRLLMELYEAAKIGTNVPGDFPPKPGND
jgi:hypothetical protein